MHKAQVSWNRIKPLLPQEEGNETDEVKVKKTPIETLKVKHLSFTYPDGKKILDDISFSAKKAKCWISSRNRVALPTALSKSR